LISHLSEIQINQSKKKKSTSNDNLYLESRCIYNKSKSVFIVESGLLVRRDWRYQSGNQNPNIEEQITQWPKEKVQKDKQPSTKHTHKTKDRVTWTPIKPGMNSDVPVESAVLAPLVVPVVLI
jgi:hypothetical protein